MAKTQVLKGRTGRPRVDLDINKALRLYVDEKKSLRQVAAETGVSHVTIARRVSEKTGQLRSWRMPGEA